MGILLVIAVGILGASFHKESYMSSILESIASALVTMRPSLVTLALIVSIMFLFSGMTDVAMDIAYWFRRFVRWKNRKKWPKMSLARLEAREQQKIAILIPAWNESDVIARVLANAVDNIAYRNYDIFVGTYPNDPDTQREVDKAAALSPRVHKVVSPIPGPSNKAGNLNHMYQMVLEHEKLSGVNYEIIVHHDAEDAIHPFSMLVYNYLVPRLDMIQIPVFPMAVPSNKWTHWTYADEFAENHTKILSVRERSGGFVPSAGVGTAYSRRAFELLALRHRHEVFSPLSLTEDYDLGLRMNLEGIRSAFVVMNIPEASRFNKTGNPRMDIVATQALFPTNFWKAVRQKSRWNIGIILQSWENTGWPGTFGIRWNLVHDRKGLFATPVSFIGYLVFAFFVTYELVRFFAITDMPPLIYKGTLLYTLVLASTVLMFWRFVNRSYAVWLIYGFWPALLSIPRTFWGNVVNFFAISRALWQYLLGKAHKKQVAWDKTAHEFPEELAGKEAVAKVMPAQFVSSSRSDQKKMQKEMKAIRQMLLSTDAQDRLSGLQRIRAQHGDLLKSEILQAVADPDWQVRAEACRTLSFLRFPEGLHVLETAATDPDWTVRSNAVRAISKMGEAGEESLLRVLRGDDHYASQAALAILEQKGYIEKNLALLLCDSTTTRERAAVFFHLLKQHGPSPLAQAALDRALATGASSPSAAKDKVEPQPHEVLEASSSQ